MNDLSDLPTRIVIYNKTYVLGGCTVNIPKRNHFVAYVFHQRAQTFFYFDALQNKFSKIQNRSFGDGRLSILVFLRIDDDPIIPERDGNQNVMVNEKKISNEYTDHAALITRTLRRRSKIKKRYSDFIMNTPPSSFDEDADLECALLISQNVQEKKNIQSPVCEHNETTNESESNDKIKEANILNENKAMRSLKCIDNINNKKSTKGENLKHGKVEKKGKIADNLNNTEVEDEYTKLLQHSSLCKIKITQLIAYRCT